MDEPAGTSRRPISSIERSRPSVLFPGRLGSPAAFPMSCTAHIVSDNVGMVQDGREWAAVGDGSGRTGGKEIQYVSLGYRFAGMQDGQR